MLQVFPLKTVNRFYHITQRTTSGYNRLNAASAVNNIVYSSKFPDMNILPKDLDSMNKPETKNLKEKSNTNQDSDRPKLLIRLESLSLDELKGVFKKLGGKPGRLNKLNLAQKCFDMISSTVKSSTGNQTVPSSQIDSSDVSEITGIPTPILTNIDTVAEISEPMLNNTSVKIQSDVEEKPVVGVVVRPWSRDTSSVTGYNRSMASSSSSSSSSRFNPYGFPCGFRREDRFEIEGSNDMELVFLGTASCIPSVTRGVSCLGMRYNTHLWLFDCGESTQLQIQKSNIRVSKINKVFLTHLHGDHSFGLPGILCLMGQARQFERAQAFLQGVEHDIIDIYGPAGTRDFVRAVMQLTHSRIAVKHRIHELKNIPWLHGKNSKVTPQSPQMTTEYTNQYGEELGGRDIYPDERGLYDLFEEDGLHVTAAPLQHTVPCVGYVVNELPRPGRLRVEKINDLVTKNLEALKTQLNLRDGMKTFGILKNLKADELFTFPDGTVVKGEEIVEPERKGRKVVVLGDTCNPEMIAPLAENADILIHEATNAWLPEMDRDKYPKRGLLEREAYFHGHSTPHMAGNFAKYIKAKKLILTHFSSRYRGDDSEHSMSIMWRIEEMAREASHLKGRNDVIAAWDYLSLPVYEEGKVIKKQAVDTASTDNGKEGASLNVRNKNANMNNVEFTFPTW